MKFVHKAVINKAEIVKAKEGTKQPKVVMFVQYRSLLSRFVAALDDYGIDAFELKQDAESRQLLKKFQMEDDTHTPRNLAIGEPLGTPQPHVKPSERPLSERDPRVILLTSDAQCCGNVNNNNIVR